MVFGKTHRQREVERQNRAARWARASRWHLVFAWAPVRLVDGRTAWLGFVDRRREGPSGDSRWVYRECSGTCRPLDARPSFTMSTLNGGTHTQESELT